MSTIPSPTEFSAVGQTRTVTLSKGFLRASCLPIPPPRRHIGAPGLEPRLADSESAVLPLHHEAISRLSVLAGSTGLEPATPGSTVQCANQLRHDPRVPESDNIISNPPYRMQGGNLIFYLFPKQFLYQRKITSFQETFRKYIQFI